jgi:hypothetical protein
MYTYPLGISLRPGPLSHYPAFCTSQKLLDKPNVVTPSHVRLVGLPSYVRGGYRHPIQSETAAQKPGFVRLVVSKFLFGHANSRSRWRHRAVSNNFIRQSHSTQRQTRVSQNIRRRSQPHAAVGSTATTSLEQVAEPAFLLAC